MGLLDDAIREHLDLKRRRGADPTEIERAEREALGPVRRNREPGAADDADAAAVAEYDPPVGSALDEPDGGIASDLAEEPYGDEDLYEEDTERPSVRGETYLADDQEYDDDEPLEEDLDAGDDPFAHEDPHRTQLMSTVDVPPREEATAEHEVERGFAHEDARETPPRPDDRPKSSEGEEEDVLEETPEFLQDTPDHDRLWFEQRPPRDFDFDG